MKKQKTEMTYLRMVRNILEEIKMTPKSNPKRFWALKKKAEKYINLAKQYHQQNI